MFLKIILLFVVALGIGGLSSYLYEKYYQPKVSYEDYENMFGGSWPVNKFAFDDFLAVLDKFNRANVRYLVVDSLPAVEDVVDRRSVYIQVMFTREVLCCFSVYTCVTGVWMQVDLNSDIEEDIGEFLGRV